MNNNHPPEPHTPTWCEQNPHRCKDVVGVSIENWALGLTISFLISILIFKRMKPKVKITVSEIEKLNAISKEVNRSWFDRFSTFLWGEKSFRWGELKGL